MQNKNIQNLLSLDTEIYCVVIGEIVSIIINKSCITDVAITNFNLDLSYFMQTNNFY